MSEFGDQRGAPLPTAVPSVGDRDGRTTARLPAPTWHRGGGHPTSEGPSVGVNPGDAPTGPLVRPLVIV